METRGTFITRTTRKEKVDIDVTEYKGEKHFNVYFSEGSFSLPLEEVKKCIDDTGSYIDYDEYNQARSESLKQSLW